MKQLHLSGYVGWYMCSDEYVKRWLQENSVKKGDDFEVVIFSGGGGAFEGIAIYNTLKAYRPTVIVNGLAASAASLIACAGKEIKLTTGSQIMIHNPQSIAQGEKDQMRKTMEALKELEESAIDIYAENCSLSREDVRQMMADTRYMRYEELKEKGFKVTQIQQAELNLDEKTREVYAQIEMYGAPRIGNETEKTNNNVKNDINNQNEDTTMSKDEQNSSDALAMQLSNLQGKLDTAEAELSTARETITARDASVAKLTGEKKALQAQLAEAEIDSILDAALSSGKIKPGQKETRKETLMLLKSTNKDVYDKNVAELTADADKPAVKLTQTVATEGGQGKEAEFKMESYDPTNNDDNAKAAELAYKLMEAKPELSFEDALDQVVGGY